MADRTSVYNFLYSKFGDKWYPGFDYENMLTVENEFKQSFDFIGAGIITGWTVENLTLYRSDQLSLISNYLNNPSSDTAQRFISLNLNFANDYICAASTTQNISLSGGAPSSIDGIALAVNDKVLVKNQTTINQNGVYTVSVLGTGSNGTWVRDSILNSSSDYNSNFVVYVEAGTANTSTLWIGSISGNSFTLNSTNLYFDNAFKQCVRVSPGTGVVDSFAAKTELSNYFRFTKNNNYYIWAESLVGTKKDQICKISCPLPPNEFYDDTYPSTYLATVTNSAASVNYDLSVVSTITYEDRRQNLSDLAGEFQESLRKNYLAHRHLGNFNTPSQVNLETKTVLNATNSYNGTEDVSSTVLILKNQDGTDFVYSNTYGIPKVYLNETKLSDSEYVLDFASTPTKIYLKNSISLDQKVTVELPNDSTYSLFIVDDNGTKISGTALTYNVFYQLSDGTTEYRNGSNTAVYKNFSWDDFSYLPANVYLNDNLQQVNYYNLYPNSGYIKFDSITPTINSNDVSSVKLSVDKTQSEVQGSIDGKFLNIDASKFTKGTLPSNRIKNLTHNNEYVLKSQATFYPSKYLVQTNNRKFYYPVNTLSDLQYNSNVKSIYNSVNFGKRLYSAIDGLYTSDSTFTKILVNTNYLIDNGVPVKFVDNLISSDNDKYFAETYVLSDKGNIYRASSLSTSWKKFNSPLDSNQVSVFVNDFEVSTEKIQTDVNQFEYYRLVYAATNQGVFGAKISENTSDVDWQFNKIQEILDSDGTILSSISNAKSVLEITAKNSDIVEGEPDLVYYDKKLYVASDDGLFVGNYAKLERIFNTSCKGTLWVKGGTENVDKNILLWWSDYDVYITHSARYIEDSNSLYWELPFTQDFNSYVDCSCATTSNITLSGLQTIDGYSLTAGNRVLVKNQTDPKLNGIYEAASGAWSRSSDLDSNSEFIYGSKVTILNGTTLASSIWFLKYSDSYQIGTTEILWDIYKLKVYSTSTPIYTATRSVIKTVVEKNSNRISREYIVAHVDGLAQITESGVLGVPPSYKELVYDAPYQGEINSVHSYDDNSSNGLLIISTTRGIYKSANLLWQDINTLTDVGVFDKFWVRTESVVSEQDEFSVYDSDYTITSSYDFYFAYQLVDFNTAKDLGKLYFYDREYTDFYILPWKTTEISKARVVVYVNSQLTKTPYTTNNELGLIRFSSSLRLQDRNQVTVSVARNNPYISNVGSRTHNEILEVNRLSSTPLAILALPCLPTDSVLYLNSTISSTVEKLLLVSGSTSEIVYIESIDNSLFPVQVTLSFSRNSVSNFTFPVGSTIFSITDTITSSIETDLFKIISNSPYDLISVDNLNHGELALSLKDEVSTIFDIAPLAPFSQTDTRGLKNFKLVDDFQNNSSFDQSNSEIYQRIEIVPTGYVEDPKIIYGIANFAKSGTGMFVATNLGVWKFNGSSWEIESQLDNSKNIYYIEETPIGEILVGTEKGLWKRNISGVWSKNISFNQLQYAHILSTWGSYNLEVFGKSDGVSIVKTIVGEDTFISENAGIDSSVEVFGIHKDSIIKISNSEQSFQDVLILATNNGLYACTDSANLNLFSPNIISREMLGDNKPSDISYYKSIFRPLKTPQTPVAKLDPVPLFVLTDKGVLKIHNWQWCYPESTSNYQIEERLLEGYNCKCYVLATEDSVDDIKPGKSKIFIGTDRGVFRSFDGGDTFMPSERMNAKNLVIYQLIIEPTTYIDGATTVDVNALIASTNDGIWYSINDGDDWYRADDLTIEGFSPIAFSSFPTLSVNVSNILTSSGSLAQTFVSTSSSDVIDKVSVYLDINTKIINQNYQSSLTNNVIRAYLYSVTSGLPNSLLATSTTTYTPQQILGKQFVNFEFNYTTLASTNYSLVIAESVSAGNISVTRWKSSQNLYSNGKACEKYSGSWNSLYSSNSYDYYLKVHFTSASTPSSVSVPFGYDGSTLGWDDGKFFGTLVKDDGSLTIDSKFLISIALDDTSSMQNYSKSIYIEKLRDLLQELSTRTTRNVSGTDTYTSAFSIWSQNDYAKDKTSKFTTSMANVNLVLDNVLQSGKTNDFQEALNLSMINMNQDSVVQINSSETGFLTKIINYLNNISALRLSYLNDQYDLLTTSNDWDGTSADIVNSENASNILLNRWSESYIPVLFVITDNSDISSIDIEKYNLYVNDFWKQYGFKIVFVSIDESSNQGKYLPLVLNSNGLYSVNKSTQDWVDLQTLLMHGGNFNLFKGTWSRELDFDSSKYISSVESNFSAPSGSSCLVEVRYSTDRKNFTSWSSLTSGVSFEINKSVTILESRITLTEGWDGSNRILPIVSELYYVEKTPSIQYYFTNGFDTQKVIDEYILADNVSNSQNTSIDWGICRGDSTDWNDFEPIIVKRNGILPNRQKSLELDTNGDFIAKFGENTTTVDYQTYNLSNGIWAYDSNVVVYVNNQIVRDNYIIDRLNGCITFYNKLSSSDIVRVYVQNSNKFRIGARVKKYTTGTNVINFGLQFTEVNNLNKYSEYTSVPIPYLLDNKVNVLAYQQALNSQISVNNSMYVDYQLTSSSSTLDQGSSVVWYINKGLGFKTIDENNLLPNYGNRIVQRKVDLAQANSYFESGDIIKVEVQPYDGYKTGLTYSSSQYTLVNKFVPYVKDVQIKSSAGIVNNSVSHTANLTAYYSFTDTDNSTDQSIVEWYDWTTNTLISTGASLGSSYLSLGQAISFVVQPYDGEYYGQSAESQIINII